MPQHVSYPLTITSDNGGNFVKADRELKEAFAKLSEGHLMIMS